MNVSIHNAFIDIEIHPSDDDPFDDPVLGVHHIEIGFPWYTLAIIAAILIACAVVIAVR